MSARIPGFIGEYLWELDMASRQLLALAESVPEERYGWKPVDDVRTFSAVLVHLGAANFGLLLAAGSQAPECGDLYGHLRLSEPSHLAAMILKNTSLERSITGKAEVITLLRRSLEVVAASITAASAEDLERPVQFFGEQTTVRRVYLRILAHCHEHMGQAIAYVRASGGELPWPDPVRELERSLAAQPK